MNGRAIGLALAVVLSACDSSGGGTAVLKFQGSVSGAALASVSAMAGATLAAATAGTPTTFQMKLVAAYLAEDVDGNQDNVGHTPMIYLNPECQGDIEHCDISAGTAPDGRPIAHIVQNYFDFALPADQVNAALNAQSRKVATGSYKYVRVEFCKNNSGNANNVKWGTADVAPIEFRGGDCVVTMPISPPISIGSGDAVTITLNYDLAGTVQTGDSAFSASCTTGSGGTRECFTVPPFVPSATK
jgi:hypothetical protein